MAPESRAEPRREPAAEQMTEGDTVDQLHHDVELAVASADVVDRDDAGKVQRGGGACLLLEAPDRGRTGTGLDVQHLDRDAARPRQEMRAPMLDLANDSRSLSDFKRNTVDLLDRLGKTGHPLVLTINGRNHRPGCTPGAAGSLTNATGRASSFVPTC